MIYLAIFILSLLISWVSIPSIIKLAKGKNLFDEPDERKQHEASIPNLGGIAIFGGIAISSTLFLMFDKSPNLGAFLAAILVLFFTGVKDDIIPLTARKKMIAQLVACFIIVLKGDIRLTSLYGFFNYQELPMWASISISVFTILVIINSLNLIDGINGLAGGVACIIGATLGYWFYLYGYENLALISIALCGSLVGFLRFNLYKARIFMGDTGSLLIGLVIAVLAIEFIELGKETTSFEGSKAPIYAVAVLIIPLFDTIRVFIIRVMKGRSPLSADRNHIHHALVDGGLSHFASSMILFAVNILFVFGAYLIKDLNAMLFLAIILSTALLLSFIPFIIKKNRVKTS